MKIKEFCKKNRKKIIIITISLATVLVITAGVAFYCLRREIGTGSGFMQGNRGGAFASLADAVSASGVTSVGMEEVQFEVENLTTELDIEEVYVSSEQEIQAGDKILKLSDESVAEAREELEQTLQDADLAYRAGAIAYEQSKITAEYDRDSAILDGQEAEQVYQETIASLENSVEKAEEELADAQEQIAEYQSYVNDGSYSTYFKVDEYKATYDENLKVLTDKMDEWGISWSQVTSGSGSGAGGNAGGNGSSAGGSTGGTVSGGNLSTGDSSQYVKILSSLYSVLEQNAKDLEQAQSDYEDAVANAQFELQTLELQLPSLQQAVTEAKENYETQILQAKLTKETSLANAERAENDYETAIEKAEADYEDLKSAWEDAKENLELFESSVGDGYFYATAGGTILRTRVRAEQTLVSGSTIFMYSNPEEMTVTVSVDQSDIANVAIGDTAYVQSTTGSSLQGTVTEINPVTTSTSMTSVTYNVTVTLSGDTSQLSANQSVTVVFGIDDAAMQNSQKATDNTGVEQGDESDKN